MGQPYLYKRETAISTELMDLSHGSDSTDEDTWFLLFATKNHWRQNADLDGIREGLHWLEANYESLGITSIAMPALGCGLGGLSWDTVGPLMCSSLSRTSMRACVYLPAEHKVAPETTTPGFLLGRR